MDIFFSIVRFNLTIIRLVGFLFNCQFRAIMELLIVWRKLYFLLPSILQEILEVKFQVQVFYKIDSVFIYLFILLCILCCLTRLFHYLYVIPPADFFKFFQHGNHQLEDCGEQKIQTDCHGIMSIITVKSFFGIFDGTVNLIDNIQQYWELVQNLVYNVKSCKYFVLNMHFMFL